MSRPPQARRISFLHLAQLALLGSGLLACQLLTPNAAPTLQSPAVSTELVVEEQSTISAEIPTLDLVGTPLIGITPRPTEAPFFTAEPVEAYIPPTPLPTFIGEPTTVGAFPITDEIIQKIQTTPLEFREIRLVRARRVEDTNNANLTFAILFTGGQPPYQAFFDARPIFTGVVTEVVGTPEDPIGLVKFNDIFWTCGVGFPATLMFQDGTGTQVGTDFYFDVACE